MKLPIITANAFGLTHHSGFHTETSAQPVIRVMNRRGSQMMLMTVLMPLTTTSLATSHRTADAAVLADAPEVHRHQERQHQGESHAVEHIEAEQRGLADEASAEQAEAHVGPGVHQRDVSDLQERCAR